ncbi:MAG: hypothetical protein ABIW47_00790 [Ginsengibacter sp.]|jgi:hypothetical protein
MPINRKSNAPLLLAGLAAFAYYKFNKMSPEKKNDLKKKGMDLVDKYVPQPLKDMFSKDRIQDAEVI